MDYAVLEQRDGFLVTHQPWATLSRVRTTVGRAGEILIGARTCRHRRGRDPLRCERAHECDSPDHDFGVSAVALTMEQQPDGWSLRGFNRNGLQIIPWCGPRVPRPGSGPVAALIEAQRRVAVHIRSSTTGREHFLMLRTSSADPGARILAGLTRDDRPTAAAPAHDRLLPKPGERVLIRSYFSEFIAWPPRLDAKVPPASALTAAERSRLQNYMIKCRSFCLDQRLSDPTGLGPDEIMGADHDKPVSKGAYSLEFLTWLAGARLLTFDDGDDLLPR